MPILIAVQGISNSGKTSSIEEFVKIHRGIHLLPFPPVLVVPIVKSRGLILGVGKNGDSAAEVNRTLDLFRTHHCDIVVCATKSKGESVDALDLFKAANPTITVIPVASRFVPPYVPGSISTAQAAANSAVAALVESHIP